MILKHGLKNACIPVVTVLGFRVAEVLGGAVTIEIIYNMPGMGSLAVNSVQNHDVPVLLGFVFPPRAPSPHAGRDQDACGPIRRSGPPPCTRDSSSGFLANGNAQIKSLAAQAADPTLTHEQRAPLYHQIWDLMLKEAMFVPICNQSRATSNRW